MSSTFLPHLPAFKKRKEVLAFTSPTRQHNWSLLCCAVMLVTDGHRKPLQSLRVKYWLLWQWHTEKRKKVVRTYEFSLKLKALFNSVLKSSVLAALQEQKTRSQFSRAGTSLNNHVQMSHTVQTNPFYHSISVGLLIDSPWKWKFCISRNHINCFPSHKFIFTPDSTNTHLYNQRKIPNNFNTY